MRDTGGWWGPMMVDCPNKKGRLSWRPYWKAPVMIEKRKMPEGGREAKKGSTKEKERWEPGEAEGRNWIMIKSSFVWKSTINWRKSNICQLFHSSVFFRPAWSMIISTQDRSKKRRRCGRDKFRMIQNLPLSILFPQWLRSSLSHWQLERGARQSCLPSN